MTRFDGNAFANVALAFAVLELTGSKADLGYVLAARALLFLGRTQPEGPLAERPATESFKHVRQAPQLAERSPGTDT